MSRGKLGDTPTIKLHPVRFAQYAKKADAKARQGREPSAPEIEVRVVEADDEITADDASSPWHLDDEADTGRVQSDVVPASRSSPDEVALDAVPIIAVSREDLAWFELEADAHALIALIDGHTTVDEILASVAIQRAKALALLKELEVQRVIALS
jgi:hypothetical protein